ncbi:protease [Enterobacter bugandensis]|uniref:protease n=1 Tax=Enterobacter bugandensis TaxID=881260 RepID=UPI001886FFC6|nr:protease [Enterobacter bugandensis]MBF2747819.1 protease [Enterobacter bugandensis]MBF2800641.1 protease [Enterobacter bugandensis]MCP1116387.1 protease [Enterobacter bugandensis]MDO2434389.1 protease [Enterobacter bugandensis]MDO2443813.1 protease [Enterobacter bugandensis]
MAIFPPGTPMANRDTEDGFLLDVFNWTGSVEIPDIPEGFLNLLGLPDIGKASGGTAGLTLDGGLLKFPARIKPSGVTFTFRISGTVRGQTGVIREWKMQIRRPDGVTIVGSASTVKVRGTAISNRDVILRSFTSGAADPFTTQGVMVGLQNDSGQRITLTSVSIRVDRNVNAE